LGSKELATHYIKPNTQYLRNCAFLFKLTLW
jgi:hypothetical protein